MIPTQGTQALLLLLLSTVLLMTTIIDLNSPTNRRATNIGRSLILSTQQTVRRPIGVLCSLFPSGPSAQNPEHDFPWNDHPPTTNITGGTFIGGNVNRIQHHGEATGDAFHDSAERYPQPQCHPDTRRKFLEDLLKWAHSGVIDELEKRPILRLHGPAGAGKSAVAQTKAASGGSFFFKRGHSSRGNARWLLPTIAYQLAFLVPELKQHISLRGVDPESMSKKPTASPGIDGLDECEGENVQQAILRVIGSLLSQESLPILFLVASRPEAYICETLAEACLAESHRALNICQSFEDVRKYLEVEFDRIHQEHQTMTAVPFPWPEPKIVERIVWASSGYFIYAATVVKFIDDKRFQPPERLDVASWTAGPGYEQNLPTSAASNWRASTGVGIPTVPVNYRIRLRLYGTRNRTVRPLARLFTVTVWNRPYTVRARKNTARIRCHTDRKSI
ncbi:hypothetical protein B0H16DRAFT_1472459 [Mycena metata]|uniref:Nephrocystin 3-like N-terminal domain-containing protein n=1 Tax=Mycena metata TaxID=1033252 RepID=A0AAD7MMX2_9AGAR|nr:hypothetical protein B0H16DRAFT_1472459 [Mycena metata]